MAQDYAEAMRWYRKAADQGDVDAQQAVGLLYSDGWGVEKDYGQAMHWFRKAADQHLAAADLSVAMLYGGGFGVTRDPQEAKRWLDKAAVDDSKKPQGRLLDSP